MSSASLSLESFQTFGDLLKFLRRRERLTQLALSITVGYSEAQISRLEQNQRKPDLTALKALFIPALHLESEPELVARLLDLAHAARQETAPAVGVAPYRGLLFFDEPDADLFFGREALTQRLADRTTALPLKGTSRLLALVGSSGSGKSSLVRAGLAVALKRAGWDVQLLTPTGSPLRQLEASLPSPGESPRDRQRLIVIDQFEELFTLCRDENEQSAFVDRILALAQDESMITVVIIALRADFYAHCAQYPQLREAVAAEQEYIGQMSREELQRAIEEPAKRGGWEFEPGLVDLLLSDVGAHGVDRPEPGALPLLSHALLATWERRRGRTLTIEGYRNSGGIRGAIAQTAENVFSDRLDLTQQNLARYVFLRLTELGEGTEDTGRRAALNELVRNPGDAPQLRAVLDILADARLVTLTEDSVEVAHEALIREWDRLREWLAQDRDGLRLHRHLTDAAREWIARGNDPAELYRGARLAQVSEWTSANSEHLNLSECAFIAASMEREQHDARERETQRQHELETAQRLAGSERGRAEEQTRFALEMRRRARYLGAAFTVALVLAGVALSFSNQSDQNALDAMGERATAVANADNTARLLNTMMGEELLPLSGQAAQVGLVVHSSDRKMTAARYGQSSIIVSDTATGNHRFTLALEDHMDQVTGIAFSPDGTRLASSSADGTAILWDLADGKALLHLTGHTGPVESVAFSPDGKYVLTGGDTTAILWDAITGRRVRTFSGISNVRDAAYSPDGIRIATANLDGTAKIWDVHTGKELLTLPGFSVATISVAFSPDGKWLVSVNPDGTARVWNATTGEILFDFIR